MNLDSFYNYINNFNKKGIYLSDYQLIKKFRQSKKQLGGTQNIESILSDKFPEKSKIRTYTIPTGTILFHGTKSKETFDPYYLQFNDLNLISFFSTNIRFAADCIARYSNHSHEIGYIHMFEVIKDIDKILILSFFDINNKWTMEYLKNNFCNKNSKYNINGIGFFIPKLEQDIYEFALCHPNKFLQYINTRKCIFRKNNV